MKVGTDAILLGAWCDVRNAETILDVGTGSGIIALLLAARSKAKVDAVELNEASAEEAGLNFTAYNKNQLSVYHDDFINFANIINKKYDLIISNPPFFSGDLLPENSSRKAARHVYELNHDKLCEGTVKLLGIEGRFNIVLPTTISDEFVKLALSYGLHLYRQQLVFPKPNFKPNRVNMEFRFNNTSKVISEDIIIRDEDGNHTNQYKEYVDYYLINI